MSANAGFAFDSNADRPKYQSRFGSKQNTNGPKRTALREISDMNEVGFGNPQMMPQNRPPMQQRFHQQQQHQIFRRPSRNEDQYDPVERMYPPEEYDPPPKFEGFTFTPSNDIDFDDEIELEPLVYRGEINWF